MYFLNAFRCSVGVSCLQYSPTLLIRGKKNLQSFFILSLSLSLIYFILLVDHHFFLIRISLLQSIQFDQIVWSDEFVLLFVCRLSNIGLKKEFLDLQFLSTA